MAEKYFYYIVRPNATVERVEIPSGRVPELENLQKAVDGYIETVSGPLYPLIGIVNEEGRLRGLADNPIGSMAIRYPELLCGNVVIAFAEGENIVGFSEKDADEIRRQIHRIRNLFASYPRAEQRRKLDQKKRRCSGRDH